MAACVNFVLFQYAVLKSNAKEQLQMPLNCIWIIQDRHLRCSHI